MAEEKNPKEKDCPTCYGKGQAMISCCTGEAVHDDLDFCPTCHEHMGEDDCPDCDGTGKVPMDKDDFSETTSGVNSRAEHLRDIQAGH